MTVTVVQGGSSAGGAYTGTFANPVTAGNTLIYFVSGYGVSSPVSSDPVIGGVTPAGSYQLYPDTVEAEACASAWLLPDIPGGSTAFGITATGYGSNTVNGLLALEIAGAGSVTAISYAGGSATTSVNSGSITAAGGLVVGQLANSITPFTGSIATWQGIALGEPVPATGGYDKNANAYFTPATGGSYAVSGTVPNSGDLTAMVLNLSSQGGSNIFALLNTGM